MKKKYEERLGPNFHLAVESVRKLKRSRAIVARARSREQEAYAALEKARRKHQASENFLEAEIRRQEELRRDITSSVRCIEDEREAYRQGGYPLPGD